MGLFGHDEEQDSRLDAIEAWLKGLSTTVQQYQLQTAELNLELMKLKAQVDEKLSGEDFDPLILQLSDKITEARAAAQQAKESATENWKSLQENANASLDELSAQLDEAADKLKEES